MKFRNKVIKKLRYSKWYMHRHRNCIKMPILCYKTSRFRTSSNINFPTTKFREDPKGYNYLDVDYSDKPDDVYFVRMCFDKVDFYNEEEFIKKYQYRCQNHFYRKNEFLVVVKDGQSRDITKKDIYRNSI